jgi:hypothetical protein
MAETVAMAGEEVAEVTEVPVQEFALLAMEASEETEQVEASGVMEVQ